MHGSLSAFQGADVFMQLVYKQTCQTCCGETSCTAALLLLAVMVGCKSTSEGPAAPYRCEIPFCCTQINVWVTKETQRVKQQKEPNCNHHREAFTVRAAVAQEGR